MHENIRLGTVLAAFCLGWIITVISLFIPPQGIVDETVLVVLGQGLSYSAVGLGMKDYVDTRLEKWKRKEE